MKHGLMDLMNAGGTAMAVTTGGLVIAQGKVERTSWLRDFPFDSVNLTLGDIMALTTFGLAITAHLISIFVKLRRDRRDG